MLIRLFKQILDLTLKGVQSETASPSLESLVKPFHFEPVESPQGDLLGVQ